jgi:hypothetical protein
LVSDGGRMKKSIPKLHSVKWKYMENIEMTPYAEKSWAAEPRDVLSGAYNANLKEVYIMGKEQGGEFYFASSGKLDHGRANMFLDAFKSVIIENWKDQ